MHPGSRSPAPGSGDASDRPSTGGCDARSLAAIGVWESETQAKEGLNAFINPVHAKFCDEQKNPQLSRDVAGVDDSEWSFEVVSQALRSRGFHLIKVQKLVPGAQELRDVNLRGVLMHGDSFLLDGYINDGYKRSKKAKRIPIGIKRHGEAYNRTDYRHSIAVIDNEVHDSAFLLKGPMSADLLWLRDDNQPDRCMGFMREILRVYRVQRCTGAAGCKGACVHGYNDTFFQKTAEPLCKKARKA